MKIMEITDLSGEALQPYVSRSEVLLRRYFEPEPGIFIAETARVIERALLAGYAPLSLLVERTLLNGTARALAERCGDVPIFTAGHEVLEKITGYHLTEGILCAMRRLPALDAARLCEGASRVAVLEDVENPTNVGAIFRSAAALGFDAVLLTEGCSDPLYRRSIRVSMGAVFQIPFAFLAGGEYAEFLKSLGFVLAAMTLRKDSLRIDDERLRQPQKLAVFLGNENAGLRAQTQDSCDYAVRIPMAEGIDSLNVAAAAAVAFWCLGNARNFSDREDEKSTGKEGKA